MPLVLSPEEKQQQAQTYNTPEARLSAVTLTSGRGGKSLRLPGQNTRVSLDDLEKDTAFQADADKFLEFMGTNDDIFETLRDSDYNLAKGIHRAATAGDWPEDVKQAYGRLRTQFDNADTGSFNQYLEAAKDIGVDVISDPTVLATLFLAPFTGGASAGARAAATQAAKVGTRRLTQTALGAVSGAAWGGVENFTRQKIAEQVGLQDSVNGAEVLATAAIGGVLGGALGKFADSRTVNKAARVLDETHFDETLAQQTSSAGIFSLRPIAKGVSATVGRPVTILDPLREASPEAASLQRKFASGVGRRFSNPFNPKARSVREADFFTTYNELSGRHWTKIKEIIEPLSRQRSGHLDKDVNDALVTALRKGESGDATIDAAAKKIRGVYDDIFQDLSDNGLLGEDPVQNYFKRKWNRAAIEKNDDLLKRLLIEDGEAGDMVEAGRIVEELLDKENQLSSVASEVFNVSRKFNKIADDSRYTEFLDNDFKEVTFDYITQTSKKLSGVKTFGVKTQGEFNERVIGKIVEEAKAAGREVSRSERKDIADLYKFATGEGVHAVEGTLGVMKDWTALAYQVSMLPLATLSSLTEVVIPLTRTSTPAYAKALTQGMGSGFKKLTIDLLDTLHVKHGMTKPQVFKELNRFMLALDQTSADTIERLSGQNIRSSTARKAQNAFFKANFLTQWTQMVQATAFISGKDLVRRNLTTLSRMSDLDSRAGIRLRNELADLGVEHTAGMRWIQAGARLDDPFYEEVQKGASLFVNEIILPTAREAGTKPHIMSNPMTDIFFQFLSYPAAFTNVVLKNMATEMAESPIRGSAKVIGGGLIMTEMARYGNWVRSEGRSEEGRTPAEARLQGLIRTGGNGLIVDMMTRARDAVEATGSPLGAVAGFTGPLVGETIQSIAYRRGPNQILGTKTPGFGAKITPFGVGQEAMDDYTTFLREQDKKLMEMLTGSDKEPVNLFR